MPAPWIPVRNACSSTAPLNLLYLGLAATVAATSGLLFGYDIAVINGALLFLKEQFRLSELETGAAASSLLAGCVAGAALAGWLSDLLGRKKVLFLSALLFALSSLGAALPRDLAGFAAARLAGGIAIGAASLLAPLYIAEIAPARLRGRLVSLNQMAIVTGILLAYLVNWGLSGAGPAAWRWMFAAAALPSLFLLASLAFVPESPRWLTAHDRAPEAFLVLARISGPETAGSQMDSIRAAIAAESGALAELFQPGYRRALALAVSLAVLQQWTGVNVVLFYGSLILKEQVRGHSDSAAIGINAAIGLINFLFTLVAFWWIDRTGRRLLLAGSAACMAAAHLGLSAAFRAGAPPSTAVVLLMMLCVASFATGMGPGVWVVLSEIFPARVRGRAMSIATVSLWAACVALTFSFLSISAWLGPSGAFLLYAAMCAATLWIVLRWLPETKGRTLEEIERSWRA